MSTSIQNDSSNFPLFSGRCETIKGRFTDDCAVLFPKRTTESKPQSSKIAFLDLAIKPEKKIVKMDADLEAPLGRRLLNAFQSFRGFYEQIYKNLYDNAENIQAKVEVVNDCNQQWKRYLKGVDPSLAKILFDDDRLNKSGLEYNQRAAFLNYRGIAARLIGLEKPEHNPDAKLPERSIGKMALACVPIIGTIYGRYISFSLMRKEVCTDSLPKITQIYATCRLYYFARYVNTIATLALVCSFLTLPLSVISLTVLSTIVGERLISNYANIKDVSQKISNLQSIYNSEYLLNEYGSKIHNRWS